MEHGMALGACFETLVGLAADKHVACGMRHGRAMMPSRSLYLHLRVRLGGKQVSSEAKVKVKAASASWPAGPWPCLGVNHAKRPPLPMCVGADEQFGRERPAAR